MPSTEELWIYGANLGSGIISIIDTINVVVDTVNVGNDPIAPEYNPANDFIYVANSGSDSVSVIPP